MLRKGLFVVLVLALVLVSTVAPALAAQSEASPGLTPGTSIWGVKDGGRFGSPPGNFQPNCGGCEIGGNCSC
ncbi:MAG: hypothetical protein PVF47_11035 [Anaerolineae bacterium]|jgi:hypothetical protein